MQTCIHKPVHVALNHNLLPCLSSHEISLMGSGNLPFRFPSPSSPRPLPRAFPPAHGPPKPHVLDLSPPHRIPMHTSGHESSRSCLACHFHPHSRPSRSFSPALVISSSSQPPFSSLFSLPSSLLPPPSSLLPPNPKHSTLIFAISMSWWKGGGRLRGSRPHEWNQVSALRRTQDLVRFR
jgi:hypothetical protein